MHLSLEPIQAPMASIVNFKDIYFDTSNFELFSEGYELSRRSGYPSNHYKLERNGLNITSIDGEGDISDLCEGVRNFPICDIQSIYQRVDSVTKRLIIGNDKRFCVDSVAMEGDDTCLAFVALKMQGEFTVADAHKIFGQYKNLEKDIRGVETSLSSNLGLYLKNKIKK